MQVPPFRALHALGVDNRGCRAGLAPGLLPAQNVESMVNAIERPVLVPAPQVVVHRAPRRQVLWQRRPLAAGAQDVHHTIEHRAHVDRPLVAAALRIQDQRADDRPLFVGQITRVAQLAAVVFRPVLGRPHAHSSSGIRRQEPITTDSNHSICSRMDIERRRWLRGPTRGPVTAVIDPLVTPAGPRDLSALAPNLATRGAGKV